MEEILERMSENELVRAAMRERGMTQKVLADRMGTSQNNLSANLNRKRMSVEVFKGVLDALGYDVIVVDCEDGREMWKLDSENNLFAK